MKKKSIWNDIKIFEKEDIYDLEELDAMVEDDMVSSWEAGFMQGYDEAG